MQNDVFYNHSTVKWHSSRQLIYDFASVYNHSLQYFMNVFCLCMFKDSTIEYINVKFQVINQIKVDHKWYYTVNTCSP